MSYYHETRTFAAAQQKAGREASRAASQRRTEVGTGL